MSNVQKLSIALTHDMANAVKAAVASGEYGSNSEVIRDALRGWNAVRDREREEVNYLRKAWQKGIDSGPGNFETIDEIISAAKT